jgi:hypothetical protein
MAFGLRSKLVDELLDFGKEREDQANEIVRAKLHRVAGHENLARKIINTMKNSLAVEPPLPTDTPYALIPRLAIVALKSNVETYGPWGSIGPTGKVRFEVDDNLVPWNFNGHEYLNKAAYAKINDGVTNMQVGEEGQLTIPGSPTKNLGDVLSAGGPNITGISVDIGPDGVRTSYTMRTYTHQFGRVNKQIGDRLSRLALRNKQMQRVINKQSLLSAPNRSLPGGKSIRAGMKLLNFKIRQDKLKHLQGNTPHSFLTSYTATDASGVIRHRVGTNETLLALATLNANEDAHYQKAALMSMDGIFMPYSVNPMYSGMPHFQTPTSGTSGPTVNDLNPWGSGDHVMTDINFVSWGDTYPDISGVELPLRPVNSGVDYQNIRAIGLRGPLVLSAWGYATDGSPVPSGSDGQFLPNFRQKSNEWPTGPVDLRWDKDRKVWVAGDVTQLAIVMQHSGTFPGSSKNRYICRPVTDIISSGALVYSNQPINFSSGDFLAWNLPEAVGDIHTIGIDSPVMIYSKFGEKFFNELPRSFARLTQY